MTQFFLYDVRSVGLRKQFQNYGKSSENPRTTTHTRKIIIYIPQNTRHATRSTHHIPTNDDIETQQKDTALNSVHTFMLSLYMEEELEENDDLMLWQNVVDHAEEVGSISVTLPTTTTIATTKSSSSVTTSASSLSGGHDSRPFSAQPAAASHQPASHPSSATITSTLLPSAPLQQMNALQTACAPGVRLQFLSSFFGCYCKRYFFFFFVLHTHT